MEERQFIEMDMADTIIDRPIGFSVGSRHFYLYPVTLGKMLLLGRLTDELRINHEILSASPYLESLRWATEHREVCGRILAYHTIRTKRDINNDELVGKRAKWFAGQLDTASLAQAMVLVLQSDKTHIFMSHLKLDKEHERLERVMKVKKDKNTISFGGLSVYGTLIDAACERYGWTFDYVVWGISYTNLQLLLADKLTSVYVSDEERKKLPASVFVRQADVIKADDPKNKERIKQMSWR